MDAKRRRRLGTVVGATVLLAALAVPTALPATAARIPNQVLVWNQHAYNELIVTAGQPPPVAVLHLAMVHGAVYDAVNAIDGGFEPYLELEGPPAKHWYSKNAAAATAAYEVLKYLLPARTAQLDGYYNSSLAVIPNGVAQNGGVSVGEAAAEAMFDAREDDGDPGTAVYPVGTLVGEWRPVPFPTGPNVLRWIGQVRPFLIEDASDFATVGPQPLASTAYATEFDQVKALGGTTSTVRTQDQTDQARFWTDHAVGMWTRIFRQVSISQKLSIVENARYFAMLYLTGADALIACFEDKATKSFWRPQTAIQDTADDGNEATQSDTGWTSLVGNPGYPDHPSGHNCVSGSFVRTLRDFFGTNQMSFSATHSTLGLRRTFTRFSDAIDEVLWARVYGGLHFWSADEQGAQLGREVASYRNEFFFQPVS